ncbi:MAG: rhodanese-like domain-containing protein [Myxococcales bacterium]|nr:rhodanese-like domain-containing protein [Myxococcales bacterium]
MRLVHGVLWVVLAAGCNKPAAPAATSAGAADPAAKELSANLSVSEAEALLKHSPTAQLIDVRTLSEWSGGYIAGAKHIPLDQIETRLPEIDKSRTVVLYCAAGGRSHRAMEILKAAGYQDVRHLADGIAGWKAQGRPLVK